MDNGNFWDWDNEDEHSVSSVYRDTEEKTESAGAQNNAPQNNIEQTSEIQSNIVHSSAEQNTEVQNNMQQTDAVQNAKAQNTEPEQADATPPEAAAENNFILVDSPHNPTQNTTAQAKSQQTDYQQTGYRQTGYQQTDFQQMVPVQNIQQNQGAENWKAKQNADYISKFNPEDISENKVSAMAAYLLGPVGIIIALLLARDSAYTAFHVRQALKLTVCSVALEIIAAILALFAMIPFLGIIFKLVLIIICAIWLGVLVLRLVAIAQVCDGEAREPAVIGKMSCFH